MSLSFLKILKHLNLSKQISLLLGIVFITGLSLAAPSVAWLMNSQAQNKISLQAEMLVTTINAIREYTDSQVRPHLEQNFQSQFLPQSIPFYTSREIFEKFRANESWGDYFYKAATINPTNIRDKADSFETDIIERFRNNKELKSLRGFHTINSEKDKRFYIARPLIVTQPSCLQCHSTPDKAPKNMVKIYGTNGGFGWKLNDIVGVHIVYVPANLVLQTAERDFIKIMAIVIAIFTIVILTVNWWLKRNIVRPLKRMSQTAEAVSKGEIQAEFKQNSQDEVGRLAKSFNLMKISLEISINKLEEFSIKLRSLDS